VRRRVSPGIQTAAVSATPNLAWDDGYVDAFEVCGSSMALRSTSLEGWPGTSDAIFAALA